MRPFPSFVFAAALLALPSTGIARWMTLSEAAYSIESQEVKVHVRRDGTFTSSSTLVLKVLNENGRNALGTMRFSYRPKNEKFKVLNASIENGGQRVKVGSDQIVDKPTRASDQGFDDVNQVMVAFPQTVVGSEIRYTLETSTFRPFVEGQFANHFSFPDGSFVKSFRARITSDIPLSTELNDPKGVIEAGVSQKGGTSEYDFKLKAPLANGITDETYAALDGMSKTWVVVASSPDYATMFGKLAEKYEKLLAEPLPELFRAMVQNAKKAATDVDKMNLLLAQLGEKIRYMGDWRAVDGGFVPHKMSEVAKVQSGDCKDLSLVFVKMLRELGYDSHVALIWRGNDERVSRKVPFFRFNHAIVHVRVGERDFWLDPTNFQAFAESLFMDIADRTALLLKPSSMDLLTTQPSESAKNVYEGKMRTVYPKAGLARTQVDVQRTGAYALYFTGYMLKSSKASLEEALLSQMTRRADVLSSKIKAPDLTSRIVGPLQFGIEYEARSRPLQTSMGPAIRMDAPDLLVHLGSADLRERVSDFSLSFPATASMEMVFPQLRVRGEALKNCQVNSPWFSYKFSVKKSPLRVQSEITIRKTRIKNEELRSKEFEKTAEEVRHCVRDKFILYDKVR